MYTSKTQWEQEKDRLIELTESGLTLKDIGKLYGVSKQRIDQVFNKLGIDHKGIRYLVSLRKQAESVDHHLKWGHKDDTELYKLKRAKYRAKKANSLRAGIPFEILFGEIEFPDVCPVLGIPLDYYAERLEDNSPSFDKLIPALGYVSGNVKVISWRANRIKNDGTAEEHLLIYNYIKNNE